MTDLMVEGLPLWFFKVFALLIGAAFGSFANVVIYRVPLGRSIVRPGSSCPGCGHEIAWYENIPIASWLFLRARCSSCGTRISIRYPLIELMTAVLSLACMMLGIAAVPGLELTAARLVLLWFFPFALCFLTVCIVFIDFEHWIIPHPLTAAGIVLGIASSVVLAPPLGDVHWYESLIGAAAGALPIIAIIEIYFRLTGREGMGYGDVMLMAMAGAWFGYLALPFILLASSIQGLLGAIPAVVSKNRPVPPWEGAEAAEADATDAEPPDATAPDGSAIHVDRPPAEAGELRHLALPFGPFIGLAMIEWLFFGDLVTTWFFG